MELPIDIYNWLTSIQVLTEGDIKSLDNGNAQLNDDASIQLLTGIKVSNIIKHLYALKVCLIYTT